MTFVTLNCYAEEKLQRSIFIHHSSIVILVDLFINILVCVRRNEVRNKKYYATSLCDKNKDKLVTLKLSPIWRSKVTINIKTLKQNPNVMCS